MERSLFCGKQNTLKHGHFDTITAFWYCILLTISYHLYLLCISKVSNMLHHSSMGLVHSKDKDAAFCVKISFFLAEYQISAMQY